MEIKDNIRRYIEGNIYGIYIGESFKDEDNIFELGIVSSLFSIQLVTFIEQEYSIVIENEDLDLSNFSTIDNITRYLERKLNGKLQSEKSY